MVIEKTDLRQQIFLHLDGLVVAPTAYYLKEKGVLDFILQNEKVSLTELTNHFNANEGNLNVGLRVLASQGFLNYSVDNQNDSIEVSVNNISEFAFSNFHIYEGVVKMLEETDFFTSVHIESTHIQKITFLFEKYKRNFDISFSNNDNELKIQQQILKH